jgi:hypothetical protein
LQETKGVQVEGYEVAFAQIESKLYGNQTKATIRTKNFGSAFVRGYLIKKLQFNNLVLLKNKVTHGSLILSMDKLKSSRNVSMVIHRRRRLPIRHP